MTIEQKAEELYPIPKGKEFLDNPITYQAYLKQGAYIRGFQDANKWIDCKERLPIDGSHVIGYCFDGGVREVRFHNIAYSITHWMPLPNKPLKETI